MLYGSQSEDKNDTETLERITRCIGEGKKYIDQSKWKDWENYVRESYTHHRGELAEDVLTVLGNIEKGTPWKVINAMMDPYGQHSGTSYSLQRNKILHFTKKKEEAEKYLEK